MDEATLPMIFRKKLPPKFEKIKYGTYTIEDIDYPIHLYLKDNDVRVDETGSDVIQFLRGKSILVTGGTGFLGKVLVEKLLRCCKDIEKIYIIIRTKKEKNLDERLQEYLKNKIFVKLSEIYPNFKDKIVGISGNFEEDGLGLSEESRKILTQKVNIIYHSAATVRFDEKLKKAVKINIKGTQEMLKLAKECKQIEVFTHISTAYSNCVQKEIKEEFYSPAIDPQAIITITEKLPSDVADKLTPELLGLYPNTYAFTKQIAEDIIRTESIGIPTCIQRPAIVMSSVKEPIHSWIDNIYGPLGLMIGGGIGLLHIIMGNKNVKAGVVPVDYVINNCISASYKTAKDRFTEKVQIFNFSSTEKNPFFWGYLRYGRDAKFKICTTKTLYHSFYNMTTCWYWYAILSFLFHTIPGHILDFVAVKLGKKPQLTKAYAKIDKLVSVVAYFTLHEWKFELTNTENLWKLLNEKDKMNFAFDMDTFNWQEYFYTTTANLREFLLDDFCDTLEQGRSHYRKLAIIHYISVSLILLLSIYFLLNTIFCFVPITIIAIIIYYTFYNF